MRRGQKDKTGGSGGPAFYFTYTGNHDLPHLERRGSHVCTGEEGGVEEKGRDLEIKGQFRSGRVRSSRSLTNRLFYFTQKKENESTTQYYDIKKKT